MIQGTIYNHMIRALKQFPAFHAFQNQEMDTKAYLQFLESHQADLEKLGLDEDQIHLSSRLAHDEVSKVDGILYDLKGAGVIDSVEYPKQEFDAYRQQVYESYDHGQYSTYIFPDEERLLYALAHILQPKSTVFLGSYYGYWGIWAMPGIQKGGGKACFLDVNPDVNALAERNYTEMGFAAHTEFLTKDGIGFCESTSQSFDLVVLDAECPKDHPNPEFRGKGIYGPLTRAVLPKLQPGATMVTHNILLENTISDSYFENKIKKNQLQLASYLDITMSQFAFSKGYNTTEGTGVYKMPMSLEPTPN